MYNETKIAVKKAFEIGRTLFFMGKERYGELLNITSKILPPTKDELKQYTGDGLSFEDAIIVSLKEKYEGAAVLAGFTSKQGCAMLEYAALLEELKHE